MHHQGVRISELERLRVQELLRSEEACVAKTVFLMNQGPGPGLAGPVPAMHRRRSQAHQ